MGKLTIEKMQKIAEERGGKCLSKTYVNSQTPLRWECGKGHKWKAMPSSVKSGRWCRKCSYTLRGISRRLNIEEMQEIAKQRDGKCLSDTYVNNSTKLTWECVEGHQWEAIPCSIKRGHWCQKCVGLAKGTIEKMQKIAEERGGKCLSKTYVNSQTRLRWECGKGHKWKAMPSSVKSGKWCRKCAGLAKGTIEEMQKIAEERGGKCLSKTYINSKTPLEWKCAEGHQWEAKPNDVKGGSWCPYCAGIAKGTIEEMQEIAKQRGGKCLSDTYVNKNAKLLWECAEEHQWEAIPHSIKRGSWCRKCAGLEKGTIEEMQKIAEERGGKCLSNTYVDALTKLTWECVEGHQWEAKPNNIKTGRWCPDCVSGLGERICRVFFEQIFSKKFPRSHPRWLVNKRGNQMELDGFCQSLALAFEHHGEQHYSTKGKFIKSKRDLKKRQEADRLKRELCHQQGVILIEIPEIPNRLSIGEIKTFIKKECNANSVSLPSDYDTKEINLKNAYTTSGARASLEEIQKIAKERGGKCLSDSYVNSNTKLLWECSKKHKWKATPSDIKSGRWCRKCSYTLRGISLRLNIEEMQEIAKLRGGKCLSDSYIDAHTKLTWECAKGHQWEAKPNDVKGGTWCQKCAGKAKGTIEEMRSIAAERGGKCLSDTYVDAHTKLAWECVEGHQWEAKANSIKSGSWCRKCANRARR